MLPDGTEPGWGDEIPEEGDLSFGAEVAEAFGEVASRGMGIRFAIGGEAHTGVIRNTTRESELTEPGYKPTDEITIATPRVQFSEAPSPGKREIVQIEEDPYSGKWVLLSVTSDAGLLFLTCVPSE